MKNSDIFYPEEKHNGSITILDQIFRLIFLWKYVGNHICKNIFNA